VPVSTEIARPHEAAAGSAADDEGYDPVIGELHERLRSLDANCLQALQEGLEAIRDGDLTV
jgi:hypothetical protein